MRLVSLDRRRAFPARIVAADATGFDLRVEHHAGQELPYRVDPTGRHGDGDVFRFELEATDCVAAAEAHGRDSEPDHTIGDLQDYLQIAFDLMAPDQRGAFLADDRVRELLEWGDLLNG